MYLEPNDHIWAKNELNLATLLRSDVDENPDFLLNFNPTPTMTTTAALGESNLDNSSNLRNVPQNQTTKTVLSDYLGDSLNTTMVNPNPHNRDENRNYDIASFILQEY